MEKFLQFMALVALQLLALACSTMATSPPETGSWDGAPWQAGENSQSILEQSAYSERPPTIFSPTGRLHPVERIVEASKQNHPQSNLVVAVKCQDGLLVFSTVPLSPYLNTTNSALLILDEEPLSSSPIVDLTPGIVGATAGSAIDCQLMQSKLQAFAEQTLDDEEEADGSTISELSRRIADHRQVATQRMYSKSGSLLASVNVLLGDNQVWRVDPTGQFWKCYLSVVGRGSNIVEEALYTKLCRAQSKFQDSDEAVDISLEDFITKKSTCGEVREIICECLQDILFPEASIRPLPVESRNRLQSIPWVAVQLEGKSISKGRRPLRKHFHGAFLPPLEIES